jgi:hypothetical protein
MFTDMNYWFHNRVDVTSGFRLNADVKELEFSAAESGGTIMLSAFNAETFAESGELLLQGRGYPSQPAARNAGLQWRHYLTDAFAHLRIPIDMGADDEVSPVEFIQEVDPPDWLASAGVKIGDRIVVDANEPRLLIFNGEPTPRISYGRMFTPTVGLHNADHLIAEIERIRQKPYSPPSESVKLAYRLLQSTLNDPTREADYIQLVTAVEALAEDANRPKQVRESLDSLIEIVRQWEKSSQITNATANTIVTSILQQGKKESIRQNIFRLVEVLDGTYAGLTPKKFADKAYSFRSALVHGEAGEARPSRADLETQDLRRMVLDLLDGM